MYIDKLIKELKECQDQYADAQCFVGMNPKALYVVMGYRTLMLKLDGDWDFSGLVER